MNIKKSYKVWVDGACSGNPGPGGWGVVIENEKKQKEFSGAENLTTNNRMELTAAIEGLKIIPDGSIVQIFTDSTYVKNGITEWMPNWKNNGWKTSAGKSVKNQDLWMKLSEQNNRKNIQWLWVKGHGNNEGNIKADNLARTVIDAAVKK